jgi:hypothetical protein
MATKQFDNYADLITFTRASFGTALRRVGYGTELVTNGTFDTDTDWTKGASWTISGGEATMSSTSSYSPLTQTLPLTVGRVYKVELSVTAITGSVAVAFRSGTSVVVNGGTPVSFDSTGNKVFYLFLDSAGDLITISRTSGTASVTIDNVSVKEAIFDRSTDPLVLLNHPTNTPRIEYDADGNRLGLLIEEARTNTMIRSEEFDNAQWTKSNVGGSGLAPVVTADAGVAPDGATTADRIVFDAVNSSGQSQVNNLSGTALTGICTFSVWLKAETGTPTVFLRIDWSGNAVLQNVTLTNQWQRYSVTMPSSASGATGVNRGQFGTRPFTGTSTTATVLAWGAQLEAGSFPTSYIPTAGATATRAADIASIPTSAFGYNQKAGTVVVEAVGVRNITSGTTRRFVEIESDSNNRMILGYSNLDATRFLVVASGSTQADPTVSTTPSGSLVKMAATYATNDIQQASNGALGSADTLAAVPIADTFVFGSDAVQTSATVLNGHIKSLSYFPRRLTNAQLQELTA